MLGRWLPGRNRENPMYFPVRCLGQRRLAAARLCAIEPASVMGWHFFAQVAGHVDCCVRGRLPQVSQLAHQHVDLLLLAHDDLVQLIQQVFGEAGLDFQIGQALVDVVCVFHAAFCPGSCPTVPRLRRFGQIRIIQP